MKAPQNAKHMLQHLGFEKPAREIIGHAQAKVKMLNDKIADRTQRIADLRAEYDIDDGALIQLLQAARAHARADTAALMSYSYSSSSSSNPAAHINAGMPERTIGAGVVNNLLTENDFIESEKEQVERLELIVRNLAAIPRFQNGTEIPPEGFTLSYDELEYLGF